MYIIYMSCNKKERKENENIIYYDIDLLRNIYSDEYVQEVMNEALGLKLALDYEEGGKPKDVK